MHVLGVLEGDPTGSARCSIRFARWSMRSSRVRRPARAARRVRTRSAPRAAAAARCRIAVIERSADLVCLVGEANAWPYNAAGRTRARRARPLVAHRPATGDTFARIAAPERALSPTTCFHTGLAEDQLAAGAPRAVHVISGRLRRGPAGPRRPGAQLASGTTCRGVFIGVIATSIIATVVRLLGPLVIRGGIDQGVETGDRRAILVAGGIFVALLVVQYVISAISQYGVSYVGERISNNCGPRIRTTAQARHGLLLAFQERCARARVTADIESLQEFASDGAVLALGDLLTVAGVAMALALVDWQMALAVFGVIAVLALVTRVFQRQARAAYDMVRERIGQVLGSLQEGITGVRVVQAFTQESTQARSFGRVNERHFEADVAASRAISWYFPVVAFLRVVALASVLAIGTSKVISGTMSIGTWSRSCCTSTGSSNRSSTSPTSTTSSNRPWRRSTSSSP